MTTSKGFPISVCTRVQTSRTQPETDGVIGVSAAAVAAPQTRFLFPSFALVPDKSREDSGRDETAGGIEERLVPDPIEQTFHRVHALAPFPQKATSHEWFPSSLKQWLGTPKGNPATSARKKIKSAFD